MAWTYSGEPGSSNLDAVRFEIADTDPTATLFEDGEIKYAILVEAGKEPTEAGILRAAARCMETLERRFAAQADTSLGSLKLDYSKMAEGYAKRASALRARASGMHAPLSGGQTEGEKEARENETGAAKPTFKRHQFDIPYRGPATAPWPANANTEEER